jgi:hypothetical protein
VAAISLLGAGAAHAGAQVARFKASGASASHNSFDGTTAYDLGVNVNSQGANTQTFLSFNTQTCNADFSVCTGIFGFGTIPNGDFKVNGANATLNTNTATNPNFTVFNYVQDANGFNTTPGVGGIVAISWKKDQRQSTSFKGVSTLVSGGFSHKNTGEQNSDSAPSTGTLLGIPLPANQSSFVGTSKLTDVVISRN